MKHYFFRIKAFLKWWLEAVDEHSLHSPFFFDFYTRIVKPPAQPSFASVENLRQKLLNDRRMINVADFGSGSTSENCRKISRIARTSLSPRRFSLLYHRIIKNSGTRSIVELGTSLGINTLYLADVKGTKVTTFEGAPAIADIAALTLEFAGKDNITLVTGNIDETLPTYLSGQESIDFAFIDANHRYEPTVRYFELLVTKIHDTSVIVVDDIHHSPEMERAWKAIRNHRLVYGSADLFRCGILFFDPSLNKQHVILQF